VGTVPETNQVVANIVGKIAQQVKVTTGNLALLGENKANMEAGQLKTQTIKIYQSQRSKEANVVQISGQLYKLTMMLNQVQKDLKQHKASVGGDTCSSGYAPTVLIMVHGVPV
jgi:hypothetical protein